MKYKRITYEDRVKIETLHNENKSGRYISNILGCSHNTVCYELRKKVNGVYTAKKAQHKTYIRRYMSKRESLKVVKLRLEKRLKEKLILKWSPERISGYLRIEGVYISTKAIYKYVYTRSLDWYLMSKGKKRSKKLKYISFLKGDRKYIDLRELDSVSGHYEGDFIVSSHNNYSLLVVVDKYTRWTEIRVIQNRKHATVTRAFLDIFKGKKIKSLTLDNDISFSHWKSLEKQLNTNIYFTHPYHSWEKGLVENTNRWIRLFVPKRSDISKVTEIDIHNIHTYFNNTPRQILNYKTSEEMVQLQGVY